MNKVDLYVKRLMLTSPMLFDSRTAVLSYIFVTGAGGAGYRWNPQGQVQCLYDKDAPMPQAITLSDLDSEALQIDELETTLRTRGVLDESLIRAERVKLGMRRLQRTYMGEHIDVYALEREPFELPDHPARLEGSLLFGIPAQPDADWARAAEEVTLGLLRAIAQRFAGPVREQDRQRSLWEGIEARLRAALQLLDATTGNRAKRTARVRDILAKLRSHGV